MVEVAGSPDALRLFGVTLIGATPQNGHKLLLTIGFVVFVLAVGWMLRALLRLGRSIVRWDKALFWARQAVNLLTTLVLLLGVVSIWFDDPGRLATAAGLLSAGLAFALQKVITATAGYFVILRGDTFNVGDRIVMGGVRGDVVALNFMQTTIMEMGQTPGEQGDKPAMWVHSRQYTGRIVTVSNAKIFDDPVYNYSRELPFIWDEMSIPVRYEDDHAKAEQILIEAASRHTADISKAGQAEVKALEQRYGLPMAEAKPRVYWRLTDNWVELNVRFLA